jgi:hypothetical protein
MGWLSKILQRRVPAIPIVSGCAIILFAAVVANRWGDPVAAAWAQAIGTIAAVAIALVIANRQLGAAQMLEERRELRDIAVQEARARATASRLASLLIDIEQAIDTTEKIAAALCESLKKSPFIQDEILDKLLLTVVVPENIYDDLWTLPQDTIFQISHALHGIIHYDRETVRLIDFALADETRVMPSKLAARSVANLPGLKADVQKSLQTLAPLLAPILPNL